MMTAFLFQAGLRRATLTTQQWQEFYQHLQRLIDAGIPLLNALQLLATHAVDKPQRALCWGLAQSVLRGLSFTAAARLSQLFGSLDLSLLEVGELSGRLANILSLLAKHHQRQQQLVRDLKKALSYPLMLLLMSAGVLSLMLSWVVPQFSRLFESAGASLPWLTRMVMRLAFVAPGLSGGAIIVCLSGFLLGRFLWGVRRDWLEYGFVHLPVIGPLWQFNVWLRFSQSLGLMLNAGLPLLQALPLSARAANSALCEQALFMVSRALQRGVGLHQAFEQVAFFPPMLVLFIALGENTGRLDDVLLHQADSFEQQLMNALATLNRRLEPCMIAFVGALTGIVVIAMYLPMFEMGKMF